MPSGPRRRRRATCRPQPPPWLSAATISARRATCKAGHPPDPAAGLPRRQNEDLTQDKSDERRGADRPAFSLKTQGPHVSPTAARYRRRPRRASEPAIGRPIRLANLLGHASVFPGRRWSSASAGGVRAAVAALQSICRPRCFVDDGRVLPVARVVT